MREGNQALLEARDLVCRFPLRRGLWGKPVAYVHAVDGVSLTVGAGETLGLVGETGSGKTTVGRILVRLQEPDSGQVLFDGQDLLALKGKDLRQRRRQFQIVFQDPMGSLNPRMRVRDIVAEPLLIHKLGTPRERKDRAAALLDRVGLSASAADKYPHEFSGGQRQRIGIARALALNPKFIVLDEPVSALDVSVQAQVVNLLQDLQEERGLAYLFIAHGLQVVAHVSGRVAVMYLGRIVELGPTEAVFERPLHPYTRALLASVPEPDPDCPRTSVLIQGELTVEPGLRGGCRFAPRCPLAGERCRLEEPLLRNFDGQQAACHRAGE